MKIFKAPIRPGSMITDVIENDLGSYAHQEVKNLKEIKEGEWQSVPGYIRASGYAMDNCIEINDDFSGDRFILFNKNGVIKRLDYDATHSPKSGYEQESLTTINMPEGITWDGTSKIRYFYHNGVVRITGFSEPLWYGYIYRKLFYPGLKDLEEFGFETESEINNFTPVFSTIAQSTSGKFGTYCMGIASYDNPGDVKGYAYRKFTAYTGGYYRFSCWAKKFTTVNGDDFIIKVGTTAGSEDIYRCRMVATNWAEVSFEFEIPDDINNLTTDIYISIYPEYKGNDDLIHIDKWIIEESKHELLIQDWYLEKAKLDGEIVEVTGVWGIGEQLDPPSSYHFLKISFVYDDGQYSLLKTPDINFRDLLSGDQSNVMISPHEGAKVNLKIFGENLFTALSNKRFTGILICWATNLTGSIEGLTWNVLERLNFTDKKKTVIYTKEKLRYEIASANRLYTRYDSLGTEFHSDWQDGFIRVGARIKIGNFTSIVTTVSITGAGNVDYFEIADPIYPNIVSSNVNTNIDDKILSANFIWDYDADEGISTSVGVNTLMANEFYDYASLPNNVLSIIKKYSHHIVINGTSFVLSSEQNEGDIIYYSPVNQIDSHPDTQIIQTPTGDLDSNIGIIERDNRFVALKSKSISQGQLSGSTYYFDKDGKKHGLYATEGYIVIDDILYFMDLDDVYTFNGIQINAFLENAKIRKLYKDNVTVNSFFAYNILEKELWMVLGNDVIIVFDYERKKFYQRQLGTSIYNCFNDYDKRLMVNNRSFLALVNHSQATFDESVTCSFKTGYTDIKNPEFFKQAKKIFARVSAPNKTMTITLTDPNESRTYTGTEIINDSIIEPHMFKPQFLFKELLFQASFAALTTGTIKIKSMDMIAGAWRII